MQTPQNKESLQQALGQFTGTEKWYRHALVRALLYTEGAQFFFEETESYWLLDIIATEYWPMLDGHAFLLITVTSEAQQCHIIVEDGNGEQLKSKHVPFTTLMAGTWKFYLLDNVLLLPSEY